MIVTSRSTVSIRNGWYGRALPIQKKKKRFASEIGPSDTSTSKSHSKLMCTIEQAGVQTYHLASQRLADDAKEFIEFAPNYTIETKQQATLEDVGQSNISLNSRNSLHPLKCIYCGRHMGNSERFRKHIQRHQHFYIRFWRKKPHRCHICPKVFSFMSELAHHQSKDHVMTINTVKNATPTSEDEITVNILGGTNHKGYQCLLCEKIFRDKTELTKHQRNHEVLNLSGDNTETNYFDDKSQWECPHCLKAFHEQNKLAEHLSMSHNKGVPKIKSDALGQSHESDNPFKCPKCMLCFSDVPNLSKHLLNHALDQTGTIYSDKTVADKIASELKHECPCCEKTFDHEYELTVHVLSHTNIEARFREDFHKCPSCKRVFTDGHYLIEHLKTHDGKDSSVVISTDAPILERPHKCTECEKTFARRGDLNKHLRIHSGEKPYSCDHCPKRFANKSNLTSHTRTHTHEKFYECPICQKGFSGSGDLKKHIRVHTLEKPYQCNECPKSFATKSNLSQHLRIHSQEKKYECHVCGKGFTQNSNLRQHVRTHTCEKPYQCSQCEKSFANKSNLNKHINTHRNREKIHQCQHCDKSFVQKRYLIQHVRTHNLEKPYQCNYCRESFSQNRELTQHVKTHALVKPFRCAQCSKSFTEVQDLLEHSRIHMVDKPYVPRSYSERIELLEMAAKLNETEAALKAARPDGRPTSLLETSKEQEFVANPKILHMMGKSQRSRYYHEKIAILQTAAKLNETEAALKAARAQKSKLEVSQASAISSYKKDVLVCGYRCDHCQKSFSDQVDLDDHKQSHSLDTPYQCNYCSKSFVLEETMKAHMKTH